MYNPYLSFIGKNIRYCRKRMGLTMNELAKGVGMAPAFLGLVERGQRGTSIDNLVKLSDYLNITLEEMIKFDLSTDKLFIKSNPQNLRKNLLRTIKKMNDAEVSLFALFAKALNKFEIDEIEEIDDLDETEKFGVIYKNSLLSPD